MERLVKLVNQIINIINELESYLDVKDKEVIAFYLFIKVTSMIQMISSCQRNV